MFKRKRITAAIAGIAAALTLGACASDADVVSDNISEAADNFEVERRIVMFNGITDEYLLTIQGRCNIVDEGNQLEVTCKIADGDDRSAYKKHFLGLSDNVSYFVEQTELVEASAYHYRVTFKPQTIVPDVDFRGSTTDGPKSQN